MELYILAGCRLRFSTLDVDRLGRSRFYLQPELIDFTTAGGARKPSQGGFHPQVSLDPGKPTK